MEYSEFWVDSKDCRSSSCGKSVASKKDFCPQLPGTVLRVSIPPGATINLLNILEISFTANLITKKVILKLLAH